MRIIEAILSLSARCDATTGVRSVVALCVTAFVFTVGCASSTPDPIIVDTGPNADVTVDGLHRALNPTLQDVWVKPDVDFSQYTEGILTTPEISYKRDPRGRTRRGTGRRNYALTQEQAAWIKQMLGLAFLHELEQGKNFTMVSEPGPNTLIISPEIIDLVVTVPTQSSAGRETIITSSAGRMTLLLELRDSESREILARAADRREARTSMGAGRRGAISNASTNADAVRRIFATWARILRERLDQVHQLKPVTSDDSDT
jgi:hypothetical protein